MNHTNNEKLVEQIKITWGKSGRENQENIHLLIYHLLDSAAVALAIWNESLSNSIKQKFASLMDLDVDCAGNVLASWVGLHDIGKASPVFQGKIKIQKLAWEKLGFVIPEKPQEEIYHAEISCLYLMNQQNFPDWIAVAISGHHGRWKYNKRNTHKINQYGDSQWDAIRAWLTDQVVKTVGGDLPNVHIKNSEDRNAFAVWLSGFICMADWVASNEDYFFNTSEFSPDCSLYFQNTYLHAVDVIRKLGWIGWKAEGKPKSFVEMYAHLGFKQPRVVQQKIIEKYQEWNKQSDPFLMIIEAPTGIGKTEIALYIADLWLQKAQGAGLYVAMPTMATSNMIFERCLEIFENRYGKEDGHPIINTVLAHGQAGWNEKVNHIRIKEIAEGSHEQTVAALDWFQNNRKRSLLAPFGIGTVDQIFMAVLQTKHFFVRLAGLKNKVIIFDEVHAYDIYMGTLFERLLSWLRLMGASVIVLSATLPESSRQNIMYAYAGREIKKPSGSLSYPRTTFYSTAKENEPQEITFGEIEDSKELTLNWLIEDKLVDVLTDLLKEGGCAAVICNTVRKAQAVYECLCDHFPDVTLFHAQFPMAWRAKKEKIIFSKYGKKSSFENQSRPIQSIIVSTQILEQSLDLDFDVMFTELAPMDLIIQRVGRLHRHDRLRNNPALRDQRQLFIFEPELDETNIPIMEKREKFYAKSILLKTYYALKQFSTPFIVEKFTKNLIEEVYGDQPRSHIPSEVEIDIKRYIQQEQEKQDETISKAKSMLLPSGSDEELLNHTIMALYEEDDLHVHQAYRAQTRDFGPSIQCICVLKEGENYYLASQYDKKIPIPLESLYNDEPPMKAIIESLVSLNNMGIIQQILADPTTISKSKRLRYYRILIFEEGKYQNLSLSESEGIRINSV